MNTTFAIIKPNAVENRHSGEILSMIEKVVLILKL